MWQKSKVHFTKWSSHYLWFYWFATSIDRQGLLYWNITHYEYDISTYVVEELIEAPMKKTSRWSLLKADILKPVVFLVRGRNKNCDPKFTSILIAINYHTFDHLPNKYSVLLHQCLPIPATWLGSVINHPTIINAKATLQLLRYGKGTQAASSSHWILLSFHWSCCLATASKAFLFTPSYESFNGSVETKETPLLFKQQDVATHRHAHPNVNQLPRTSKQVEDFLSSKGPQVRLPVKREGNLHS